MTHKSFEDLLLLHMTHSISEADRVKLFTHLESCADCRAALVEWQQIARAVKLNAEEKNTMTTATRFRTSVPRVQRPLLPAVIALIAVIFVAYFGLFSRPTTSFAPLAAQLATPTPTVYVELVLAARDIEHGTVLTSDDVTLYRIPVDYAPFNGMTQVADAVGKIARTNLQCGLPVMGNLLVEDAKDVSEQPALSQHNSCNLVPLSEPVEPKVVVVAIQEMDAGMRITKAMVALRAYPAQLVPADMAASLEEVVGQVTSVPIYREEMLSPAMLQAGESLSVHIAIPGDLIQNADSIFYAGDHIDVIATMLFVNVDPTYQAPAGTNSVVVPAPADTRRITQRVASYALIASVAHDGTGKLTELTLMVTPTDAAVLAWVVEAKLPLVLSLLPG